MKSLFRITSFITFVCSTAVTATAHPGHGETGVAHYITDPLHLLTVMALAGGVAACLWLMFGKRRHEQV